MHLYSSVLSTILIGTILSAPTSPGGQSYKHRGSSSTLNLSPTAEFLRKRPSTNIRQDAVPGQHPPQSNVPSSPNSTNSIKYESNAANPNYWIPDRYHGNLVCLLAAFSGTVKVRPSNSSFRGGIFKVSPEESLGRRANCERHSRHIFWKFSQHEQRLLEPEADDDDDLDGPNHTEAPTSGVPANSSSSSFSSSSSPSVGRPLKRPMTPVKWAPIEISNRQLSVGFHAAGQMIEFHVAYIECLQSAEKNMATDRFRVHSEARCVNLSVSFDLGSFGERAGFECFHIWGKTLRDVHYSRDRKLYAGEAQIALEYVRIDRDPVLTSNIDGYTFRKKPRRCLADSLLSWQSLAIIGGLFIVFLIGFFALCVCSNSSCSDDLSPGSYSSDSSCCSCCYSSGSGSSSSILSRILCFCCNRRRRISTPRGHGCRGELLNRSTYERNLLDRSNQSDHLNHMTQHDGHECHTHHHNHNHHNHNNHSTMGSHHQRHYGGHRHIRRPAPPPLLPPPPPPPSSSSTGTTHVDSELLVLPVGHTSECQVLLELLSNDPSDYVHNADNVIQFNEDDCECIDDKLIVLHSSAMLRTSTPADGYNFDGHVNDESLKPVEKIKNINIIKDNTNDVAQEAMFHYFCACFLLTLTLIRYQKRSLITVQYHQLITQPITNANNDNNNNKPYVNRSSPLHSPTRFTFSTSKFRAHHGSNDHVRSLN